MMTCEEVRLALGAHALGALDPDEALEIDNHLATCEECGRELLDLEGVASFLGKVSERDVELVASPPRQVLDRLLNASAKRNRRGRLLLVAAASVALLGLGGTIVSVVNSGTQQQAATGVAAPMSTQEPETMRDSASDAEQPSLNRLAEPSAQAKRPSRAPSASPFKMAENLKFSGVNRDEKYSATVSAYPGDSGTDLYVSVRGVPVDTTCRLLVVAAGGRHELTESWTVSRAAYLDKAEFKRSTTLPMSEITAFYVVDRKEKVLIRIPVRK
ncbi:anti-sigma factor family protein [Nonomuraea angiospora]|uniref:anti-sigma factor family protein n=1 Tax=Nonomuraea angiospora TaxID=46172 RepID=UPI0029A7A663|nr:zf-HC2 domain-containing protein [Nonomuraea angiospora]MDX3101402.1 zf-HC2 domain-containing protein [Nonomuraea angiospora]